MAKEEGSSKSLWQRLTQTQGSENAQIGDTKQSNAAPNMTEADFPKPTASEGTTNAQLPNSTPFREGLARLFGTAPPAAPLPCGATQQGLKPISTRHPEPISHPELAFSPSDIGVWEINKARKGAGGFFS